MSDTEREETYDYVSVLEFNETAERFGREPGKRVIMDGHQPNWHRLCEETEGFVKIGDAVAIIELDHPRTSDEVNEWLNTASGKLALAHWFDHIDPSEVASV
ncbi:hypothetical protein HTZ84_22470 [Haloterrigena sp. SYSU A558-1]|uniref:Uncharacterized protein n=1 Tax=Haloterrigena gelatinilytica TaxID=2741724 RepID=A0ABX2LKT5_9EURY|nr:hypothetical protein [Haloterrigena gelatinilytica]NUC75033.1 hypothetical protein [Haloterrigena gelatinilytica]